MRRLLEGLERVTGARPGRGLQVEVRGLTELERSVRMTFAIAAALTAAIALAIALAEAPCRYERRGCAPAIARAGS
jgi:hypothetical protein